MRETWLVLVRVAGPTDAGDRHDVGSMVVVELACRTKGALRIAVCHDEPDIPGPSG
ncbi:MULTISPECIES: hypothetical protein [unclassified Knoellia]|uniref:hypothetical protein n=1 Tax=Knoellia altitudinis TaxID=3404795 RepID=UPI0036141FDC